jgi:hypothetical protein
MGRYSDTGVTDRVKSQRVDFLPSAEVFSDIAIGFELGL